MTDDYITATEVLRREAEYNNPNPVPGMHLIEEFATRMIERLYDVAINDAIAEQDRLPGEKDG